MSSTEPALAVQVVIFENPVAQLRRLAAAVSATTAAARSEGLVGRVVVRWGDCSPRPVVAERDLADIRALLVDVVDDVSYTHFEANLGSAGGSNALAALGSEELVWVLNPDTYPSPTCVTELVRALGGDSVAAAEARQIPIEHPKAYDPVTGDTGWAAGACLLLDREAFRAVNGFDERFFPLYCDDVDLSWRLRLAGYRVVHVPSAVVFHDKRPHADGGVRWSPHEARSSTLARLWLYRRYGRPDLETDLVEGLERSADPAEREVAAEYRKRVAVGDVPATLADAARVAEFVDGQFAPLRFVYAS